MLFAFTAALLGGLFATPVCRWAALRWGIVDQPGIRKVHRKAMPYMGGVGILTGVWLGGWATFQFTHDTRVLAVLCLATLITAIGLLDDRFNLSPVIKLGGQLLVAILTIVAGISIPVVVPPWGGEWVFGILEWPIAVFWMVGVMNMINLIDGLDGLAGGISVISAIGLAILSILGGYTAPTMLAVTVAGAGVGFLKYNTTPATIFMGDAGALLLGYLLAVISMMGILTATHTFSSAIPMVVLAIPIMDTLIAIIRRRRRKQPIFSADKEHLHHQLLRSGYSVRQSVMMIYTLSVLLSGLGVVMILLPTHSGVALIGGVALLVIGIVAGVRWVTHRSKRTPPTLLPTEKPLQ